MPSTYSFSMPRVCPASTVTTPSLPASSMTSAITSPISSSCAEIFATALYSSLEEMSFFIFSSSATTASTALSMPRLMEMALEPLVRCLRPASMMACARTVAVVVPSPAASLVLVAASFTSCAPMFSNLSSSSISLATVTPSLVTVGAPYVFSMRTLRPLGPMVARTASVSLETPARTRARAAVPKRSCFAIVVRGKEMQKKKGLLHFAQYGFETEDFHFDVFAFLVFELHVVAGVPAEEDLVAHFQEFLGVGAVFTHTAAAERNHHSFGGFFAGGGIRDYDAGCGDLFFLHRNHDYAVSEWLYAHCELGNVCHSRRGERSEES